MSAKKAIIFANGELSITPKIKRRIAKNDFLIAVDGGLGHILALELIPDLAVGDFDSLSPQMVEFLELKRIPKIQLPVHKDETDLEAAVQIACDRQFAEILILGATGGRLDHGLENIFILSKPAWESLNISILDDSQEIFIIRDERRIRGKTGDIVSLLPLTDIVSAVTTDGLYYPLKNEDLYRENSRGISNLMTSEQASVKIKSGILLCFHISRG
jgi:thiamine pyrophosphokinase